MCTRERNSSFAINVIYCTLLEYNPLNYSWDDRFKDDDDLLKCTNCSQDFVEEIISSCFGMRKIAMRELREKNVDTQNKTYYESGIWSVIESRGGDSEIPA